MININEYLVSKTKEASFGIKATNENIKDLVNEAIKNYGTGVDLNFIDTSKVTNMNSLFDQTDFEGDISYWNVSNVTNMNYMFYKCENFNCNLSNWELKNLKRAEGMFEGCSNFIGIGLDNWELSKLEYANFMFANCENFNQDLSKWDPCRLKHTIKMFYNCEKLKGTGLEHWTTSSLEDMKSMFDGCLSLDVDLSKWDTTNVKYYDNYFLDSRISK